MLRPTTNWPYYTREDLEGSIRDTVKKANFNGTKQSFEAELYDSLILYSKNLHYSLFNDSILHSNELPDYLSFKYSYSINQNKYTILCKLLYDTSFNDDALLLKCELDVNFLLGSSLSDFSYEFSNLTFSAELCNDLYVKQGTKLEDIKFRGSNDLQQVFQHQVAVDNNVPYANHSPFSVNPYQNNFETPLRGVLDVAQPVSSFANHYNDFTGKMPYAPKVGKGLTGLSIAENIYSGHYAGAFADGMIVLVEEILGIDTALVTGPFALFSYVVTHSKTAAKMQKDVCQANMIAARQNSEKNPRNKRLRQVWQDTADAYREQKRKYDAL